MSVELFCFRCGSRNIDSAYSSTHDRCRDCGFTTRLAPADADLRPPVEQDAFGIVRTTRREGAAVIVEHDPFTGRELSTRPVTRKDTNARPTPVAPMAGGHRVA